MIVNDDPLVRNFLSGFDIEVIYSHQKDMIPKQSFEVVFIDQFIDDTTFLQTVKTKNDCRIVGLDYFNYSNYQVDTIINLFNQSLDKPMINKSVEYYEGLEFAIIGSRFKSFRKQNRQVKDQISRVLIMMGGADPTLKTCDALQFITGLSSSFNVDVVIGPLCAHEQKIRL